MIQCFTLGSFESFLIWLVGIILLVAIARLLLPRLMTWIGAPPGGDVVLTILGYILWAVVIIFIIVFAFEVLSCALNGPLGLRGVR